MLTISHLTCEYASDPLGIGTSIPRFSWQLTHPQRSQRQTAYRIVATLDPEPTPRSPNLLWDSGKVAGADSVAVEWGAQPLASRLRVYWRVRCWDAQDRASDWSPTAWFETALLDSHDWQAQWLGFPAAWPGRALYVRRQFTVGKPPASARAYVCGLGYHELYVNGRRLGNAVLDPAYTDVSQRVMYRTFDITRLLRVGENVFAATLGNGWHGSPRMLAQIELRHIDGSFDRIVTEPQGWRATTGPIVENSVYGGEVYDARLELPGWNQPGTPGGEWTGLMRVPSPGGALTAQPLEPIERIVEIAPASVTRLQAGVLVVDLGQNIAGWLRLRVRGKPGQRVTLRFAESLYPDGTVNQENLRQNPACDVYILQGVGEETWEPRFTYHGFRYVQVEGYPGEPGPADLVGVLVRSAVADAGQFTCSSELLNSIQTVVRWTEQDNLHGIPTDCPQRNERMGWLNDMTARAEEAIFNFGLARLLAKWIGDIRDAQDDESGAIAGTAPWSWSPRPADPVCVSYLETAWLLYAHYGDRRTLEANYSGFQRWLRCLTSMAHEEIVDFSLWGDWAPPAASLVPGTAQNRTAPGALMSTGYYYYTANLLARVAAIVERQADSERLAELAHRIGDAFNQRFWDESAGGYGTNSQSCNAFALWLGLVPEQRRRRVLDNLVRDVVELHGNHLTTGNVCTKYLLETLAEHGRADVALAVAAQTSYPSWGYMLANGATTLWERWELETGSGMNSHNHPMLGSVSSWFYKCLAGIQITAATAGFDHVQLRPCIVTGLDYAEATHRTVRGLLRSGWRRRDGRVTITVDLPVATTADVTIPLQREQQAVSEGGALLWERAAGKHTVDGLSIRSVDSASVTVGIGSGSYVFDIT